MIPTFSRQIRSQKFVKSLKSINLGLRNRPWDLNPCLLKGLLIKTQSKGGGSGFPVMSRQNIGAEVGYKSITWEREGVQIIQKSCYTIYGDAVWSVDNFACLTGCSYKYKDKFEFTICSISSNLVNFKFWLVAARLTVLLPVGHLSRICVSLTNKCDVIPFKYWSVITFDCHMRSIFNLKKTINNICDGKMIKSWNLCDAIN